MEWKTLLTTELQKLNAQEINEVRNTLWKSFSGDFKVMCRESKIGLALI